MIRRVALRHERTVLGVAFPGAISRPGRRKRCRSLKGDVVRMRSLGARGRQDATLVRAGQSRVLYRRGRAAIAADRTKTGSLVRAVVTALAALAVATPVALGAEQRGRG